MKMIRLVCMVFLVVSGAYADTPFNLVCPPSETISNFQSQVIIPYGFNYRQHRAKFIDYASSSAFGMSAAWHLVLYPVSALQTDNVHAIANAMIKQLEPVFPTPFLFNPLSPDLEIEQLNNLPFCVYAVPGRKDVTAMAFYVDPTNKSINAGELMKFALAH